jgi:hypothetical protein
MSSKSITIIAIIVVLCYVMYNILMYYDFGLSYLGSYIAFYMFMLGSSLVLPSTDLDLNEGGGDEGEREGEREGEKGNSFMDMFNKPWNTTPKNLQRRQDTPANIEPGL